MYRVIDYELFKDVMLNYVSLHLFELLDDALDENDVYKSCDDRLFNLGEELMYRRDLIPMTVAVDYRYDFRDDIEHNKEIVHESGGIYIRKSTGQMVIVPVSLMPEYNNDDDFIYFYPLSRLMTLMQLLLQACGENKGNDKKSNSTDETDNNNLLIF